MMRPSLLVRISFLVLVIFAFIFVPTHQFIWKWDHFRITDYPRTDESYLQTNTLDLTAWTFLKGLPKMLKKAPVWGSEDPKYLQQVKFKCFMYNGQPAIKTTQETSPSIREDFEFTAGDMKLNPRSLKHHFKGRKDQRFAFVIHGWSTAHLVYDIHLKPFGEVIATDMRSNFRMNVIVVDWTPLSSWDYFVSSKGNLLYVAYAIEATIFQIADLMDLNEKEEMEYLIRMILLGHSLGAHLAGIVGDLLKIPPIKNNEPAIKRLGTIIGLDPAGPWFPPYGTSRHCLSLHDARRVLILHTAALLLGNAHRLGHEDYFARGGAQVVKLSPGLSHMRVANLIRELIWTNATGYICMRPSHIYRNGDMADRSLIRPIEFDLAKIPHVEAQVIPYPIYLPVNLNHPYFDNQTPQKIPAYSVSTKKNWDKIRFKFFNRFIR